MGEPLVVTKQPTDRRAQIIRACTFLGGIYFFLYWLVPEKFVEAIGLTERHESISNGFIAVGAMAIGLGLFNLISAHGDRIVFRKQGWAYSLALLLGLFSMLIVTIAQWQQGLATTAEVRKSQVIGEFAQRIVEDSEKGASVPPLPVRVEALRRYTGERLAEIDATTLAGGGSDGPFQDEVRRAASSVRLALVGLSAVGGDALSPEGKQALIEVAKAGGKLGATESTLLRNRSAATTIHQLYRFLYDGVFNQLGAAMFALLGVYIAAAAYRAFRIRSVESALMMISALVVMLGQISLGQLISDQLPELRQWLLEVPNSAAFRAIRFGAAVAGLMLAVRMWLSIESKSFSSGKGQ
jgi:hypothetical protein